METSPQSTWEAVQDTVAANRRIYAVGIRNYVHVWERVPDGDVLHRDEEPRQVVTRQHILQHRQTPEELRQERLDHLGNESQYWQISLSSQLLVKRRGIGFLPGILGKKKRHLLLLDMDLSISDENRALIAERAKELLVPRYGHFLLAESGKSYHLIGTRPMTTRRLRQAYGDSLLMDVNKHVATDGIRKRLVDTMYVGHCLADRNGMGNLRITGNAVRPVPRVVGRL